ncbi:MAG: hypothetical protein VX640_05845 [Pseudomonadota bacterium]|nr:hypothetical protein [Pseudomonadota bacterium]
MSGSSKLHSLAALGADGFISARDVLELRRTVFADGVVSTDELDALFDLGDRAPNGDREWADFFAEAASDFYLREEEPRGYLTDDEFRTLKTRLTRNGERASDLEIGLLVKLMENAVSTPAEMSGFTAKQIKRRIAERQGGPRVTAEDASLIRRFLFAAGGDGNVAVTREEAEFLFDLNDVVSGAKNDPSWTDLFCKAVSNHLMAHIGYKPVGRETALRRQAFMQSDNAGVAGVLGRMFSGGIGGVKKGFGLAAAKDKTAQQERNDSREAGIAEAEAVTSNEADWLADRISRDGAVHDSERALIRHLKSLDAELPPKLKAIVSNAA